MKISHQDVLHIAALARLRLAPPEVERFTVQLNTILEHMEVLRTVDAAGAEAVGGAAEWAAPLRDDDGRADPLARPAAELAPAWMDGFFTVPRLPALDTVELEEAFEDKARADEAPRPAGGTP